MEMKMCRICNVSKPLSEYNKSGKYYRSECKECRSKEIKQWKKNNKEKIREYSKIYRKEHKELYKQSDKKHYIKNKVKISERQKEYRLNNKEKLQDYDKKYYNENKDKIKLRNKKYITNRRKEDYLYKLKSNVRNMIYNSFHRKKYYKKEKAEKILGCSIDCFIEHLLTTFKNNYGYNWNGIEKVHIDHIIPLFIANTEEEVMKLCNYKNLQLLKEKDNLRKSNKVIMKGE